MASPCARRIFSPFADGLLAHEGRQDRLAAALVGFGDGLGRLGDLGHDLRRQHDDDRAHVRIVGHGVDCQRVAVGHGVAQHVHRVGDAGGRRQARPELVLCFYRQRGQLQAGALHRVGGHDARPAGVGDDGHGIGGRQRLAGEGHGHVEQVLHRAGAQHAGLLERGLVGPLRAGQGAGVAGDRPAAGLGRAGLDRDDRGVLADLAGDLDKAAAVGDAFQIGGDDLAVGIVAPHLQEVDLVQVGLVAQADEATEADVVGQGHVEDAGAQRARLRHEGDPALHRHAEGETGLQRRVGVDDAQAVRADHAYAVAPDDGDQFFLHRHALRSHLTEAGRDCDHALDALLAALLDNACNEFGGNHNHGQVDRAGDVEHAGIGLFAQDLVGLGVDRVDLAGKAMLEHVEEHGIAQLRWVRAGADDGYGARIEELVQVERAIGRCHAHVPQTCAGY